MKVLQTENKSLIKSTQLISVATLASRILGFIRDVIIARLFGTGVSAQAFVVAFRIPNFLRNIVGEGSTNAAVVPVLSHLKTLGKEDEFWQVANSLLAILMVLLAALTLWGELFASYIVRSIAPGFIAEPTKLILTIQLTRWMLPYLFLIGLTAYAMAVLNSLKYFALPALAPCMLNISLIASSLIICPRLPEPVYGLAIGVLIGGILQLAIQVPLLLKQGLWQKFSASFIHPQVKEIGRLFLPRTLGIIVYEMNIFVDTILASLSWIVGEGAVAALYYANRIVQFPLALFGVALAQVALPTLSDLVAQNDFVQLKKTISFSLRSVFTMMIPATVGIIVLAQPLTRIIFERGSFTVSATTMTAAVLLFYCLSITGYCGIKILASVFYALRDTVTPVKVAAVALGTNIVLNLILIWPLKVAGLALATSISVTVNFLLLWFILRKRIGAFGALRTSLGKTILASLLMGMVIWFIFYQSEFLFAKRLFFPLKFGLTLIAAIAAYLGALKLFAKEEAQLFIGWILRKK